MADLVSVAVIRQQNIVNTTSLCKLERKIQEFKNNIGLKQHVINFLNQEINYSHLNQTNKTIIVQINNNLKDSLNTFPLFSSFDFGDQQLLGFLEVLSGF